MTTLRGDGYLETDDPVVAACFLGFPVYYCDTNTGPETLNQISKDAHGICYDNWDGFMWASRSILIHAKVVAEVVNAFEIKSWDQIRRWNIIAEAMEIACTGTLLSWLKEHMVDNRSSKCTNTAASGGIEQ